MWAIMKTFHVLPNDPMFRSLTDEQIDFLIMSMNRETEEYNAQIRGNYIEGDYTDEEFAKIMESSDEDWEVMAEGQDPDDIYRQVVKLTGNAAYEKSIQERLDYERGEGLQNKLRQKEEKIAQQQEQYAEALKRAAALEKAGKGAVHKANSVIKWDDMDDDDFDEL